MSSRYNQGYGQAPINGGNVYSSKPSDHGWNYTGQNTQSRVEFYENSHGVKMDYYPTTGEYHGPW